MRLVRRLLYDYHWTSGPKEQNFLEPETLVPDVVAFGAERRQP